MMSDEPDTGSDGRVQRARKSETAFRTISEVSDELDVPQHVLRFWEARFDAIQPLKRGGGRRYYRPEDIVLLKAIRHHLYDDGFTIKGVQKLLSEKSVAGFVAEYENGAEKGASVRERAVKDREPGLPLDFPVTEAQTHAREAKGGLTPRQRAEIEKAVSDLLVIKSQLLQVVGP